MLIVFWTCECSWFCTATAAAAGAAQFRNNLMSLFWQLIKYSIRPLPFIYSHLLYKCWPSWLDNVETVGFIHANMPFSLFFVLPCLHLDGFCLNLRCNHLSIYFREIYMMPSATGLYNFQCHCSVHWAKTRIEWILELCTHDTVM